MQHTLTAVSRSHWLGIVLSAVLLSLTFVGCAPLAPSTRQGSGSLVMLDGTSVPVEDVEAAIAKAMERGAVPGLSCAIVNDGQIVYRRGFGYKDKGAGTENDAETIFAAASFSKTAFAYLVVLLAEDGIIDLDRPLHEYLDKPLPEYAAYADLEGDDRYKKITARVVLSHSTGFPNWRFLTPEGKLTFMFPPGARHGYSGEGIALLQMVVQEITGEDLERLAQERVFGPLGMDRTSYVWQEEFEGNLARPHDTYGRARDLQKRNQPDAAGSMMTTAGDYAKLLVAVLNAEGKHKAGVDEILKPQVQIDSRSMFGPGVLERTDQYQDIGLAWGLGWGLFDSEHGRALFHTGHDLGWQNYTVTYADKGIGVVLMSNSDNFEALAPQLVEAAIGDKHSPFEWLGYPLFEPSIVDRTPPPEPVAIDVDSAILATYVGTYKMAPGERFRVKLEDAQLFVQGPDGEWAPLFAESETRFFIPESEYGLEFVVDEANTVTGVSLEVQGMALPPAAKVEHQSVESTAPTTTVEPSLNEKVGQVENGLVHMAPNGQPEWGSTSSVGERMAHYGAPGLSVAVIDDYELAWARGYGVRTAGEGEPVTAQTLFHAGSVAKSLSAAATLTHVEQGLWSLDDDVNNSLVSWRVPENENSRDEKVTLRRLLSHSAGLEDGLTNRGPDDPMPAYVTFGDEVSEVTLQQLLDGMPEDDIAPTRVTTVPGTSYRYANADYAIIELLLEDRVGRPFEDIVQTAVLDRLGMASSSYRQPLPPHLSALSASEHTLDGAPVQGGRANFPFHAAGSLRTTPEDLAAFVIDLMKAYQGEAGHLLSPQMAREMMSPQIEIANSPLSDAYGLGVELKDTSEGPLVWHTGGTWGSCSLIWFYPQTGRGAVVMTNSASGSLLRFEILLSIASEYDWPLTS